MDFNDGQDGNVRSRTTRSRLDSSLASVPPLPFGESEKMQILSFYHNCKDRLAYLISTSSASSRVNRTKFVGRGATFEVRQWDANEWNVQYVVKTPLVTLNKTSDSVVRSVMRELRVLSHPPLRDNAFIVSLLGLKWDSNSEYGPIPSLILEYAEFGNLENFFHIYEKIPLDKSVQLSADIAQGLLALHDCGVIHGDVKAGNILVFRRWRDDLGELQAKLSDFGHSIFESDMTGSLVHVSGTRPWMAPECDEPIKVDYLTRSKHALPNEG